MEYIAAYKNVKAESILFDLNQEMKLNDLSDTNLGMQVSLRLGEVLEKRENNQEAKALLLNLIDLSITHKQYDIVAEANIILARMYEKLGDGANCIDYLNQAKNYIEVHNIVKLYPRYYVRSSSYHRIYGDYKMALEYADKAVKTGREQGQVIFEADGHLLLGLLYAGSDVDKALIEFSKAADHWYEIEDYSGYSYMKMNMANIYQGQDKSKLAMMQIEEALEYIKTAKESETDIDEILQALYSQKAGIYQSRGQLDSVITYMEKSHIHQLLSMDQSTVSKLDEIEEGFAKERDTLDIEQKEQVNHLMLILLMLACLSTAVLAYLLYNQRRHKRLAIDQSSIISQTNLELQESLQKQKLLLAEVHHRVKNNLQIILSLVDLQKQNLKSEEAKEILSEISKRIFSISLVHERLYETKKFDSVTVDEYLQALYNHSLNTKSDSQISSYALDIPSIDLNIDTLIPLGMILSELIHNSIKHSQLSRDKLFITTAIKQIGDVYTLSYADNGVGYINGKLEVNNGSLGALLISSMVRQLNGTLEYGVDNGASVKITFIEKRTSNV